MDRYAVSISTEQRILGAADDEEELESHVVITDRYANVTLRLPVPLVVALGTYLTSADDEEEDDDTLYELVDQQPEPEPAAPKRMTVRRSQPNEN